MFAPATISKKPLKVNAAVDRTVRRKGKPVMKSPTTTASSEKDSPKKNGKVASPRVERPPRAKQQTPTKKKSTDSVSGFGGSVAGTPYSWPKPHETSPADKATIQFRQAKQRLRNQEKRKKTIEDVIPDMYKKKNAKELEEEQQHEIQLMRTLMYQLKMQEMARQEKALQPKKIDGHINHVLETLDSVRDPLMNSHHSLDSDATPKGTSAYAAHMKSKLEFFNSNHPVDDSFSDDDSASFSSASSWDSADSDALFRG